MTIAAIGINANPTVVILLILSWVLGGLTWVAFWHGKFVPGLLGLLCSLAIILYLATHVTLGGI